MIHVIFPGRKKRDKQKFSARLADEGEWYLLSFQTYQADITKPLARKNFLFTHQDTRN